MLGEMLEGEGLLPPSKDGMPPAEKMALWTTAEHSDFAPAPEPVKQELDEVQEPPRYQEVRSFLLDGPAYQWLVENARSSALLTERRGTILDVITREIDTTLSFLGTPKTPHFQVFRAIFEIDWGLPDFLTSQEYGTTLEIAVERAITVTGSGSNAQALSCMDYMCQTWPSSGREVVCMLQMALVSPNLSCSSKWTLWNFFSVPNHFKVALLMERRLISI